MYSSKNKIKWSKKFDKCVGCETVSLPYAAKGYCSSCYNKNYRLKPEVKAKEKEYKKAYVQTENYKTLNKIHFKTYYQNHKEERNQAMLQGYYRRKPRNKGLFGGLFGAI